MEALTRQPRQVRTKRTIPNWIVLSMLILATALSFVAAGAGVLPGDVTVSRAVQSHLPGLFGPLVVAANLLGKAPVILSIVLIVGSGLLARGFRREALLVGFVATAQLANWLLKLSLESPRPTQSLVQVSESASGFGFPSGHTMGTTVLAVILFHISTNLMEAGWRLRVLQVALLLTPLIVGVSRIETGAHWPSDVLGAWLWGALASIVIVTGVQRSWSPALLPFSRPTTDVNSAVAIIDANRTASQ